MSYLIGVEREGLRIRFDGKMSDTSHPAEFGDRLENPLIGTDFGEAMLELRTKPQPNPKACYEELLGVTRNVLEVLYQKGELLFPYSVPCNLSVEENFRYNTYPSRPDFEEYERKITEVYGIKRLCISGIHVNFSISNEMLEEIKRIYPSVLCNKDEVYLKCARQIQKYESALRYFFDASPTDFKGTIIEEDSLRNGPNGYRNEKAKTFDYSSKSAYVQSLKNTLSYERYSALRLKSKDKENLDEGIARYGIERLEFRLCDIDPFDICGISLHQLELVTAILFTLIVNKHLSDNPLELLSECEDVDRKLRLGLGTGISFYKEPEISGKKKSDEVRAFIRENGCEGFINLAMQYGIESREKEV